MTLATRLTRLERVLVGGPCRDSWHYTPHPVITTYPHGDPLGRAPEPPPEGATCPTCGETAVVEVVYVHHWREHPKDH